METMMKICKAAESRLFWIFIICKGKGQVHCLLKQVKHSALEGEEHRRVGKVKQYGLV